MDIKRRRWVILRHNERKGGQLEIFCGLARNFRFEPVNDIKDVSIKTYRSKKQAISAFENSWRCIDFDYEAVEIIEEYKTVADESLEKQEDTGN